MHKPFKLFLILLLCLCILAVSVSCKRPAQKFDLLSSVISFIEENYYLDFDEDEADVFAAFGVISSLGKYNYIYPESSIYRDSSDPSGFGLLVKISFYNEIFIDWILPGSPFLSPSNGITPERGDEIYAIGGTRVSGAGSTYFNSVVSETVMGEETEFTLRRNGEFFTVSYEKVSYNFPYCFYVNDLPGVPSDFGYICLRTFDNSTDVGPEFTRAVKSYLEDGNKALILDLRGNGGGSSAVLSRVASYLIGSGSESVPLVEVNYAKSGKKNVISTTPSRTPITDPVFVLADGGTASASEALIGAMKAHGTLTALIGKETVGKGVAQNGFTYYSEKDSGYIVDRISDEDGEKTDGEAYFVQVVVGEYYIFDESKEGGKYCMNGVPFVPDVSITGENVISPSFAEDLYIRAAMDYYQSMN